MEKFKELSIDEIKEISGGLGFWATVGAGLIAATTIAIINDWDNFKAGLKGEYEIKNDCE
ncbi:hypothetical protein V8V91_21020 [Algoriphagus halophilus]|uniref:hypothetical protein n=1 Tax=Algoriphagus halophilus TaxID=226505 RepID=UPI00358E1F10